MQLSTDLVGRVLVASLPQSAFLLFLVMLLCKTQLRASFILQTQTEGRKDIHLLPFLAKEQGYLPGNLGSIINLQKQPQLSQRPKGMGCCLGALWEPGADGGRGNGSLFRTAVRCACQHLLPCKQRGGSHFGDVTGTTAGKHLPPCFFNESQGFVPLLGHRSLAAEVCESCKPSRVL